VAVSSGRMIGIFIAQLDDAYQIALWRGIESRARALRLGVMCFVGHRVDSPVATEGQSNIAYRLADRRNIDGLIVMSSAIATFLDQEGIRRFFEARHDMPQVSLGLTVAGVPSITSNGSEGVRLVVSHLARHHGLSRFALIRGPSGHPEAEERERAFRAALRESGIPFDEHLAENGTFLASSGAQAARQLLQRRLPFDALVCMNDRMAIGAIGVLRGAGVRVPEDVAVVGFDGIEEGRYITPPLTTVMQPLEALGRSAVDSIHEIMDLGTTQERVLTCTPVIRQSCGCSPQRRYDPERTQIPETATEEERRAIKGLAGSARKGDGEEFLAGFNRAVSATTAAGEEPGKWNDYLSVLSNGTKIPAELTEFARVLVGEAESRLQAARRLAVEDRLATLRAISASLAGAFEMPLMLERLKAGLARLGIDGGHIVLFDRQASSPEWSRLVMTPRLSRRGKLPAGGIRFQTSRLLPPRVGASWRRGLWVLEPLVFQNELLGYILLPGGAVEPAVYDTLREQVASALKGALLLQQVLTHERRLEAEVARRTAELTRANAELTREIERRMHLEQEVSEISNRTMQRIGQDLHDDLCQHLAGIAMHASVLKAALSPGDAIAVAAAGQIGNLLADSITRAKQIARGLYPTGLEERGIVAAVEELVAVARRNYAAAIDFRASPDFRFPGTDRALQVYRIIQEALSNALKHSGSPRVEVRLYREDSRTGESHWQQLVAEVTDYGAGLPRTITGDGMGLRIMRYRAETAGVELGIERLQPGTRVTCRVNGASGEPS
jgi:DNA-binding LacI/PurR family transcriptional regulator/signal transduction histidine kinase